MEHHWHLDRLLDVGLLVDHDQGFQFRHALIHDAAYESLLRADRRRLHHCVAVALETLLPDDAPERAPLVAHHYAAAGEHELARRWYRVAAKAALARYANREAEAHLRAALDLAPPVPEQLALQELLGRALSQQSRYGEAITVWERCLDDVAGLDDVARLTAQIARAIWHMGDYAGALQRCRERIGPVEAAVPSPGGVRLLNELARCAHFAGQDIEAQRSATLALRAAEELGLDEEQAEALMTLGLVPNPAAVKLGYLERALAIGERLQLLVLCSRALNNIAVAHFVISGDVERGCTAGLRARQIVQRLGIPDIELGAMSVVSLLLHTAGRHREAAALLPRINELGRRLLYTSWTGNHTAAALQLRFSGELERAAQMFQQMVADPRELGHVRAFASLYLASMAFERGDDAQVLALCTQMLRSNAMVLLLLGSWPLLLLVQAHARLGDLPAAAAALAQLRDWCVRFETLETSDRLPRAEAHIAAAARRIDEADAAFSEAIARQGRLGRRWETGATLLEWADAWSAQPGAQSRTRARSLLTQALELWAALGLPIYVERTRRQLAALDAQH